VPAPAALAILLGFDAALVTGFALWSLGLKGAVALLAVGLVAKVRLRARARTQPYRARARARARVSTPTPTLTLTLTLTLTPTLTSPSPRPGAPGQGLRGGT